MLIEDEGSNPSADQLNPGIGEGLGEDNEDDLWKGTTGIRKARPENVNFAKKAKRIDVKRLKDDIWSNLKSLIPPSSIPTSSSDEEETNIPQTPITPKETETIVPIGEAKTFDGVISNLRQNYPREKMSEISTSFCFICLLHLANEEGLRIEPARYDGLEGEDVGCKGVYEMDLPSNEAITPMNKKGKGSSSGLGAGGDGMGGERVVGELQALRVYKVCYFSSVPGSIVLQIRMRS